MPADADPLAGRGVVDGPALVLLRLHRVHRLVPRQRLNRALGAGAESAGGGGGGGEGEELGWERGAGGGGGEGGGPELGRGEEGVHSFAREVAG